MIQKITRVVVEDIQKEWAEGVIKIGASDKPVSECKKFLEKYYAYADEKPVLFKPTKASHEQFRDTEKKALSYFIGGEGRACLEDSGFALQPWTEIIFEKKSRKIIILNGRHALSMGNYFFSDASGNVVMVEYSFGYKLIGGKVKIILHHSSLPFTA